MNTSAVAAFLKDNVKSHIDTDEANAANLKTGAQGYIEGIQSEA